MLIRHPRLPTCSLRPPSRLPRSVTRRTARVWPRRRERPLLRRDARPNALQPRLPRRKPLAYHATRRDRRARCLPAPLASLRCYDDLVLGPVSGAADARAGEGAAQGCAVQAEQGPARCGRNGHAGHRCGCAGVSEVGLSPAFRYRAAGWLAVREV